MRRKRTIVFVSGTRAEFGLMRTALEAIKAHPKLDLRIILTGMHMMAEHGRGVEALQREGWGIDATVPWECGARGAGDGGRCPPYGTLKSQISDLKSPIHTAVSTALALGNMAMGFDRLKADIILVVGDRVEAFAAAAAGHISQRIVAHVHGGDRALGQIDDSLRHAITKLSHIHFPATRQSAQRIAKLGEDKWRVFAIGSPGVDGIREAAAPWEALAGEFPQLRKRRYALLVLHPTSADDPAEYRRARLIGRAVASAGFEHTVIIHPNNDPGSGGILRRWRELAGDPRYTIRADVARPAFLGFMRDAAALVGNSSSGIIEAASFGTPVVDIGPRQAGRQCGGNVFHVAWDTQGIKAALGRIWRGGKPRRSRCANVYGGSGAGAKMADILASVELTGRLAAKLLSY